MGNFKSIGERNDSDDSDDDDIEKGIFFPNEIYIKIFEYFNRIFLNNVISIVCKKFHYFALMSHHTYIFDISICSSIQVDQIIINDIIHENYSNIFFKIDLSQSNCIDEHIEMISMKCINCSELNISGCYNLTIKSIECLMKNCRILKVLKLYKTEICNDEKMFDVLVKFKDIEEIWLDIKVIRGVFDTRLPYYTRTKTYQENGVEVVDGFDSSEEVDKKIDKSNLLLSSFCMFLRKYKKLKKMTLFIVKDHDFHFFNYLHYHMGINSEKYTNLKELTMVNLRNYGNLKDVFPKLKVFAIAHDLRFNDEKDFRFNCDFKFDYLPTTIEKLRIPYMKCLEDSNMIIRSDFALEELVINESWEINHIWRTYSGYGYIKKDHIINIQFIKPVITKLKKLIINEQYVFTKYKINNSPFDNLECSNLVRIRCKCLSLRSIADFIVEYGNQLIELEIKNDHPNFKIGKYLGNVKILIFCCCTNARFFKDIANDRNCLGLYHSLEVFKFSLSLYDKDNKYIGNYRYKNKDVNGNEIVNFILSMIKLREFHFLDYFNGNEYPSFSRIKRICNEEKNLKVKIFQKDIS